mmetsp:Transcript_44551/g.102871  ORF Transcript_44551/g.102871 Transcript_44551/m.102871 type:complete len:106 (+) Transcript_44551:1591-1908(+)
MKALCATLVLDLYERLVIVACYNLEWPILHVCLDTRVLKLAAYQSLGIVNGATRISRSLTLCCVADDSLRFCESHIRGRRSLAFGILNDLCASTLPHANTGVRRA